MSLAMEALVIGLVLSADSFSAAMAMGARPFTRKDALKFAASSGIAEGGVALIGALAGEHIISRFAAIDHWIAFTLLAGVALHMAYEGISDLRNKEEKVERTDFHSFAKILIVSLATSLDAFGVGISLGIANTPMPAFIASISCWAFIATLVGLNFSRKLSKKYGSVMSLVGAVVLGILAVQMLKI